MGCIWPCMGTWWWEVVGSCLAVDTGVDNMASVCWACPTECAGPKEWEGEKAPKKSDALTLVDALGVLGTSSIMLASAASATAPTEPAENVVGACLVTEAVAGAASTAKAAAVVAVAKGLAVAAVASSAPTPGDPLPCS